MAANCFNVRLQKYIIQTEYEWSYDVSYEYYFWLILISMEKNAAHLSKAQLIVGTFQEICHTISYEISFIEKIRKVN